MENEAAGPAPGKMPYEAALIEVIKGLRRDPILLFGIGAGIIAVGAIAVTSSLPLVLVVAGIFVAVLVARTHQRARRVQGGDISVSVFGTSVKRSKIAKALSPGSIFRGRFLFSRIEDSEIGTGGGTTTRRPPEG